MRFSPILAAAVLLVASCSSADGSGSDTSPSVVATAPAAPQSTFVDPTVAPARVDASPIRIDAVVFEGDPVAVLVNEGDEAFDLTGYFLCNRPAYMAVPDAEIESGGFVEVSIADLNVDPTDGELALYSSDRYDDPEAIVRYVQWGADEHGRTGVAVAAGVWVAGESVDNGGSSIAATTTDPVSAGHWSAG